MKGTFDTLTAALKLEAAGVDRKQAEAVVDVVSSAKGGFATRDGLRDLHSRMATLKWRELHIEFDTWPWFVLRTYHHISPQHLHRYINEFAARHNRRTLDTEAMMAELAASMLGKRLTYQQLIGKT